MKVYLLTEIPKTGKKGQILDVSEGYGRYLIKQKQASLVTEKVVEKFEQQKLKEQKQNEKELQKAQEIAGRIDGEEVEIDASGKNGALYAAVSAKEIVKAIKDQLGVSVKAEQVKIKKPIKESGSHNIVVAFSHGLEAEVTVNVS